MLIQVSKPSTCCKSMFRDIDENGAQRCNGNAKNGFKCGKECEPVIENDYSLYQPKQKGRLWSKKFHRYLTEDEIKQGMKGG